MAIYKDPNDLVIREHFDLKDDATRKFIVSLNEDEKSTVVTALASALYDKIVAKVDDIDFGSIPKTKGDITKVDGYTNTIECLDIIKKLVTEYKESTEVVDTVIDAVNNIKQRKQLFMKAFALKVELPTMIYNLTTLAIEHSVSFLIAVCIDYVKSPDSGNIELAISRTSYKNAHDSLLFEQLRNFNISCGSGELDSTLAEVINKKVVREAAESDIKEDISPAMVGTVQAVPTPDGDFDIFAGEPDDNNPPIIQPIIPEEDDPSITTDDEDIYNDPSYTEPVEEGIGTIIKGVLSVPVYALKGAAYLVKSIIPTIRNIAYFFTSTKVKISEALAIQAQLLEINAYNLKNDTDSDLDATQRDKIASKQLKVADKLKKWSNKFAIDNKTSEKKAKEMAAEDEKKARKEDIANQIPDEQGDILF